MKGVVVMRSMKWPNLILLRRGQPWIVVPKDHAADDYRLEQMMYHENMAGLVCCRLGIPLSGMSESTPVVLFPADCLCQEVSLPSSSDPTTVCADCGGVVLSEYTYYPRRNEATGQVSGVMLAKPIPDPVFTPDNPALWVRLPSWRVLRPR